ncbi:MAG: NlpC/P60 family protein [Candidatus Zixiibacteriota bacterium]
MERAWVSASVLDLWGKPASESGRVNQALYGEIVQVVRRQALFALVEQEDGYRGWADRRFLSPVSVAVYRRLKKARWMTVVRQSARLFGNDGRKAVPPYLMVYGTRCPVMSVRGERVRIATPNEKAIYVKRSCLLPIQDKRGRVTPGMLVTEARRFLGVPYLWGGTTPLGFDCSGFVRAVYGRFGYELPRDTKDQIRCGHSIERESVRPADLLFFDRHVAIAMSRGKYVHASRGGGGVAINSFEETSPDFRADLMKELATIRRIV